MHDFKKEICNEASRLEEDVLYSSVARFKMGNFWFYVHIFLNSIIIIFSILFGALSFANFNLPLNINILSLFVVVLSMLQIFFKPYEQSRINKNLGDEYNELKQQIRFFSNVEIHCNGLKINKNRIEEFAGKKAELDYKSHPIPGCFYFWAKRSIEKKEYQNSIDK